MLPFDPPTYGDRGTIGGAIASGLSGPGRPWYGSLRDNLLGIEIVNGLGQRLQFGGQVMKNVAGFDLSRLMAGSFGTLGVILAASIKLIPKPKVQITFSAEATHAEARSSYRKILQKCNDVKGTFYSRGTFHVFATDVEAISALDDVQFEPNLELEKDFWDRLRDHKLDFFKRSSKLYRVVLPRGLTLRDDVEDCIEEWHGTLAWVTEESVLRQLPKEARVMNFRGTSRQSSASPLVQRLQRAFDPKQIFANHSLI